MLLIFVCFVFVVVMRLTKPSLMLTQPVGIGNHDHLPGDTLQRAHQNDLAADNNIPQFGLGQLLTLPQNFG